jgi:hypothetical protein
VRVEVPVPAVPVELVRDAIRLTHPDRHPPEWQEAANRVTAQLLELLDPQSRP